MTTDNNGTYNEQAALYWAQFAEKQKIRKAAWAVAVPGIVFFVVSLFLGTAAVFIGSFFGVSYEKTIAFLSEPAIMQILQIAVSMLLMTVPFIISAWLWGVRISSVSGLNKPQKGTVLPCFLFGAGFCAFANIAVSVAGEIFKNFGIDGSVPDQELPQGFFGFLLAVISTAIVPAMVEEFAFRGIVVGILRPFGDVFAIFASSAVFGILHGNFEQMPFAFLVGIVLAFVRIKTGSLIVPMAIHALNNFVSVVASYMIKYSLTAANLIYTVYIMLALLAAIFGIFLLRGKDNFKFSAPERALGAKKTYVNFFFSPAIIIFSLLYLFRALTYVFS